MRFRKRPCKQPAGQWSTSRPANSQQEAHHDQPAHRFQPPRPQRPARHRRIRTAAAIAAIAALIATGGYLATTTIGPDAAPPTPAAGTEVNPSAQTLRELHQSIAGQYGSQSAPDAIVNPSAQCARAARASPASTAADRAGRHVNPTPRCARAAQSIAGQYGPAR